MNARSVTAFTAGVTTTTAVARSISIYPVREMETVHG